jgi:hypothetical protein
MRVGGSPLLLHCHSRKRRREPQREAAAAHPPVLALVRVRPAR